jgi:hypothetical protein
MDPIQRAVTDKQNERAKDLASKQANVENALRSRIGAAMFEGLMALIVGKQHVVDLIDSVHVQYEIKHDLTGPFLLEAMCGADNIPHTCIIQGANTFYFYDPGEFAELLYLLTQLNMSSSESKITLCRDKR